MSDSTPSGLQLHVRSSLNVKTHGVKQLFRPADSGPSPVVRVYACGPTPYDEAHLGHAFYCIATDVVCRLLRGFFGYRVQYVSNVTDVDDKIIDRARERSSSCEAIVAEYESKFWNDMRALNVVRPDVVPHVTQHIPQIVAFIDKIMANGFAYARPSGVYFDIRALRSAGVAYPSMLAQDDNAPEGKAHSTDQKSDKKQPADFALWKIHEGADQYEPAWDSPWGRGRPGWSIECSAMATATLGSQVDIKMGGKDLRFPHHCNEKAQSDAYFKPGHEWMRYCLHTGHLNIAGQKMSKSLKNFTSISQALKTYTANQLRLFFLRKCLWDTVDLTAHELLEAVEGDIFLQSSLIVLGDAFCQCDDDDARQVTTEQTLRIRALLATTKQRVGQALGDSFDVARALLAVEELLVNTRKLVVGGRVMLAPELLLDVSDYTRRLLKLFGFIVPDASANLLCAADRFCIDRLVHLRQVVRATALSTLATTTELKKDSLGLTSSCVAASLQQPSPVEALAIEWLGQVRAVWEESVAGDQQTRSLLLKLCDDLRHKLGALCIIVEDQGATATTWARHSVPASQIESVRASIREARRALKTQHKAQKQKPKKS